MDGSDRQRTSLVAPLPATFDFAFYPRVPEISLELTNICNLTCQFCANPALTRPKGRIEWSLLERIVDECARDGHKIDWLHGTGEPLLWDHLEDAIALIKRKDAGRGSFATNGTLLFPDRVRKLLDVGLDFIYVSLDSLDPDIYKATRGGKLSKVIDNVQDLIRIVPGDFTIVIALMNHRDQTIGARERARFHELFGERPNVHCSIVQNALVPSAPVDLRVSSGKQQSCTIPSKTLFITKDGIAALCCTDQDSLHPLGDVTRQTINEIWFAPTNQAMFRNIALGVHACPELCLRCVLKEPMRGPGLTASIGYSLPVEAVKERLRQALDDDDIPGALGLLGALHVRNPYDGEVAQMIYTLSSVQQLDRSVVL
ncbi:MAG TPA: radical SAM protein [Candidatus Sulfotelmatobacter sp.]|nr:radical SAM protein [Candidatus Sulfotelmatobacter sp.]